MVHTSICASRFSFLAICSAVFFLFCINAYGRSLLAAARSESFRRSSYLLDTTVYRRVSERERERRYAMMQQRLDFGNFLSYSFDAAAAAVWTVEIDFFLLVVGW